ncbi:NAD(P)-dependent oxidoreductase [Kineosporia sp. NBRC 101731]|uniref:NAD-dependent epimerase/dehydratase family protein n=1 Tax=Kineosporia sp. NBRC 101731 TaxID=3032199 RepID=UPI0024A0062D|nr:NAD(P)-dependent oxidoreductase [Kineosporia sp. NBRC 101731]GLY30918.1 UDP-glucose 4-epimerase [Kineosporia sp. NBRC 101731]
MTETVAVTGALGKVGRAVVRDLLAHGYTVRATDAQGPFGERAGLGVDVMRAELTDYGQAVEALGGCSAVVHLGNIPQPGMESAPDTLNRNLAANNNVFLAAQRLGLRKVAWASSETTLGLPFDVPPLYAPVDEAHFPHPTSTYALSKVLSEDVAAQVSQWSGIPFVGLRLSNVFVPEMYANVPGYWADPAARRWNLWGYIDARDAATAFRLALEVETTGSQNVIIAAADTLMDRPSADLLAAQFPGVEIRRDLKEFETLLAIDGARDLLGFVPQHSWRDEVPGV